jgi:hypothetical protein
LNVIAPVNDSTMVVRCASSSGIRAVMAWHRIIGVLKNLSELGRRIDLGPCWVAILVVT